MEAGCRVHGLTEAPGPPAGPFYLPEDDEEEMLMDHGGPVDLGDLMQEIRDDPAWVEGLAMDSWQRLPAAGRGGLASPPPSLQPPRAQPTPQGGEGEEGSLRAAQAVMQQHGAAERDAAAAQLQPAVRALLMHPGAAAGAHQMMIPCGIVAGNGEGGGPPGGQAPPGWGPGMPAQGQAGFYACGAPAMAPPQPMHRVPSPFGFGQMAGPGQQQPGQAQPFYFYQNAASGFAQAMQPAPAGGPQQQQGGQGPSGFGGVPSPGFPPLPQPHCSGSGSGGSGGSSDGTTLRLRSSFDGDTGGSSTTGSGANGGAASLAPAPSGSPSAVPELCSAPALAAFDQAAFDWRGAPADRAAAPTKGLTKGLTGAAVECEAPSDSSDCEDACGREGELPRDNSAQVVPTVVCPPLPCPPSGAALPPLAMPPSAFAGFAPPLLPIPIPAYYESPATHSARLARHASLERYRAKKARRCGSGGLNKIRYVKRKVNADKRPRIKGRFIKAGEAADMLAAQAAAEAATAAAEAATATTGTATATGTTSCGAGAAEVPDQSAGATSALISLA